MKKSPEKKQIAAQHKEEPHIPFQEIIVGDRTLKMVLNYRAMAIAERKFRSEGHTDVLLLLAVPEPAIVLNLQFLFACSLHHYHPEIPYEEAMEMVGPDTQLDIYLAVQLLLDASLVKSAKVDPPQPEQ